MTEPSIIGQTPSHAPCTTELRRNAHVLVLQELRARFTDSGSPSRTAALDAAIAALSAQPSPGGQDALKALDDLAAFCSDDTETVDRHVAVIRAALAARQPVGEVSVKKEDANNYCLILRALGMEEEGDPVAEVQALVEARDRQSVGEHMRSDLSGYAVAASQVRRGYDVECDRCGKFCDEGPGPCQPVGQIVGYMDPDADFMLPRADGCVLMGKVEVCLWKTPAGKYTKPLYDAPPAQAVDLGAVRNAVQGITLRFDGDLPYIKGIAEALALIDSQAVGNG